MTTLGSSIDLGSIFGVATAVVVAGPGTILWIMVAGLFSMPIRFAEVFVGHKYRTITKDSVIGGPYVYIKEAFKKFPTLQKSIVLIFSICLILSTFCSLQINQTVQFMINIVDLKSPSWVLSLFFSGLVTLVVIGGIQKITDVASAIVPFMTILYIFASIVIIFIHINHLPEVICLIVKDAFSFKAINGMVLYSLITGFQRAFFVMK